MSMAEPLMPHPESPETALDPRQDAAVPEPHAEPAEAAEAPATGQDTARAEVNDALPLPNDPVDHALTGDDLTGEAPD